MDILHPLFLIPFLSGGIFMVISIAFKSFPQQDINWLVGYRTKNSMSSQERWDFAQRYSAKKGVIAGIFMSLASVIGLFYHPLPLVGIILGTGINLLAILYIFITTEKAINEKFKEK